LGSAWLWPLCLFFIMGRAMVGLSQCGAAWLAEGLRRKKGFCHLVLLKWTASHPPHDHVIIVFDAGHACDMRWRPKIQAIAGGTP
jgi:hypothetical protein